MQTATNGATVFRHGDFVLLNHFAATRVGVVVETRLGKVDVLWYEYTRADGSAKVRGEACDPARLRMATSADDVPEAMWRLKQNL